MGWLIERAAKLQSLGTVMHRKNLEYTRRARLLLVAGWLIGILWFVLCISVAIYSDQLGIIWGAILTPVVVILGLVSIVWIGYVCIARPDEKRQIGRSKKILTAHSAVKIAVMGSYGKTTMKEMLSTVLSEQFRVAATLGNGNTPIAHARFASQLVGDENILLFEFGEGKPGDIAQFADAIRPEYVIVTGVAPNHLDQYGSLKALLDDIESIRDYVQAEKIFWAADSEQLGSRLRGYDQVFSEQGGDTWQNSHVTVHADGIEFECKTGKESYVVHAAVLGKHQVAPLGLVVAMAEHLGMDKRQIEAGVGKVRAFEHRMQPYILHGATIIDDTYNGNLQGMLAGLEFLRTIPAKRKLYVTPGLVDQGEETESVHRQIAHKIVDTKPDQLVLMQNSATDSIRRELAALEYAGAVLLEDDPLEFYQNLDQFVRAGDVVLMQNDWTDNYR